MNADINSWAVSRRLIEARMCGSNHYSVALWVDTMHILCMVTLMSLQSVQPACRCGMVRTFVLMVAAVVWFR